LKVAKIVSLLFMLGAASESVEKKNKRLSAVSVCKVPNQAE
jgi:hypothetical protein